MEKGGAIVMLKGEPVAVLMWGQGREKFKYNKWAR